MLNTLKKLSLGGKEEKTEDKKPKTFAGLTPEQLKKQIAQSGESGQSSLAAPKISETTQHSLEVAKPKNNLAATVTNSVDLAQELATFYSEGEVKSVVETLRKHLNDNKGDVEHRFWYMLMDCYQASEQKTEFDKVALSFAHKFGTSPPSWFETESDKKKGGLVGKNILILEPTFKQEHTLKFKEFFKIAKEENFCRINVSPCKFEQSEISALTNLHKLFTDLRKYRVLSILMGDNNLINFCKTYMNPNVTNKALKAEFIQNEQIFWLLYLETLQWKGKQEEFENVALDYAMKFEISPPGWEDEGVMTASGQQQEVSEESTSSLDKTLTDSNIESLINLIKTDFETKNTSEIDLSHVDRIDFSAAGSISHFLQEALMTDPEKQRKVIFKFPNEMILILLEMVGVTEFIETVPRKR